MLILKLFFIIIFINIVTSQKETSLQQVHVIFRHGEKTPEKIALYPKDPYINESWYPYGFGALTNNGKMQAYNIGKTLRKIYNDFLGKIYTPDITYARSTNYDRTKMSLQLVLAGLWPPTPLQLWNVLLPWQPIPYEYYPMDNDQILKFPLSYCPEYQKEYFQTIKSNKIQHFLKSNSYNINYINKNSGLNCSKPLDLFILYFVLHAEEHSGFKLPEWTEKIYPNFLEQAVHLEYQIQTYTNTMLKSASGHLIKKIIEDAKSKMKNTLVPQNRKIFLYSGHEWNIVYTLAGLNLFDGNIPSYSSYIIFELHKINNEFGFKIFYENYSGKEPKLLIIPGCEEFCRFDSFIRLTRDIMPQVNTC